MILLIDNYDSFTYNLYHQIAAFGHTIQIVRNDELTIEEIQAMKPEAIVISPGPGTPQEAGIIVPMIQALYKDFPILGICLGHQAIGQAFGGNIVRAANILHGKTSTVNYEKRGLFEQLEGQVDVMRYHSLIIEQSSLHEDFVVDAYAADDLEIMAIAHKAYPLYGLQFHPESIGTADGMKMVHTFLAKAGVVEHV